MKKLTILWSGGKFSGKFSKSCDKVRHVLEFQERLENFSSSPKFARENFCQNFSAKAFVLGFRSFSEMTIRLVFG